MNKGRIVEKVVSSFGIFFARKGQIPIIYYHDIVIGENEYSFMKMNIAKFKSQMQYLKEDGYKALLFRETPENFVKERTSKKIIITFDDGYISCYNIVFPIMKELNLKFNIFLVSGSIGNSENYLTWDMVKEMNESGLVDFGAHTFSHIKVNKINENNFYEEIILSNELIEKHILRKVDDFCFPYGYYDKRFTQKLCDKRIYKRLYTSDYKHATVINGCNYIGRAGISAQNTLEHFIKKISGLYNGMYYYSKIRKFLKYHIRGMA